MSGQSRSLYAVGSIVKAFGIKGEVVVKPMTDSLSRFAGLKQVYVGRKEEQVFKVAVEAVQIEPRGVRLRMAEIEDRTAAENLVGFLLFVEESDRVRIPRGRYFIHDVIGMTVVDEQGATLGVIKEVLRLPANDVYVLNCDGREAMIPAVKEFIKNIDVRSKTMRVKLIEGMMG